MTSVAAIRYDRTTIALHWATALLVAILWILGQTADRFPDHGWANVALWSTHVVLGFALAALIVWRVGWRSTRGRALPAADTGALHALAKATHSGLYLLLATVVALGIVNAFVRGYSLYGLVHLPQVGDRAWRHPVTQWHGLAANVVLALAGFHAAAALVHHTVLGDGLIARMTPERRPDRAAPADTPSARTR